MGRNSQCSRTELLSDFLTVQKHRVRTNRQNNHLQFLPLGNFVLKVVSRQYYSVLLVMCEMCSLWSVIPQSLCAVKEVRWWIIQIHVRIRIFKEARLDYLIRICCPSGLKLSGWLVWVSSRRRGTLLLRVMMFCLSHWRITKKADVKWAISISLCAQNVCTYLFSLLRGILFFMISDLSYLHNIYLWVHKEFLLWKGKWVRLKAICSLALTSGWEKKE